MKKLYLVIAVFISIAVNAQIVNIPDISFKNELIYATVQHDVARDSNGAAMVIDSNHDNEIQLSEALAVYELRLSNYDYWNNMILSLEGLQSFTNLRYFDNINSTVSVPIDFTPLTQLEYIDISGNYTLQGNPILLTGLTNLKTFKARMCNITSINFTGLTNLTTVDLWNNDLTSVNFANLPNLKKIDVSSNQIPFTSLTVDSVNLIEDLNIKGTGQTSFNIAKFPNLKYLDCSSNNYTSLDLQNASNLIKLTCNNSANSNVVSFFNFTGCTALQELYSNENNFTTISLQSLVSLKILELKSAYVTNINLSNLTQLEQVDLSFTPSSGIGNCNIQGCTNLKKFIAQNSRLSSLNASNLSHLETLDCKSLSPAFSSLNVTNCTALKYVTCSSTSVTSLDFSTCPNLLELDCHYNALQTLNLSNCKLLKKIDCSYNTALTHLDLSCSNQYTNINIRNCTALHDLNLKNGIVDTATFTVNTLPALAVVNVDYNENIAAFAATVSQTPYYNFTPGCRYNTVTGVIKYDLESNGCQDNVGIANIKLRYNCNQTGYCYAYTDANGAYTLYSGENPVEVTPIIDDPYFIFSPNTASVTFPSGTELQTQDFCLTPNGIHPDLEVTVLPVTLARPGFNADYKIVFKNKGNQLQSGTINLTFDDTVLDFVNAEPAFPVQSGNELNWTFTDLMPHETREILVVFNLNTPMEEPSLTSGDVLSFSAAIDGAMADETADDNQQTLNQTVVNSFDPNDKTCLEGNTITTEMVGKDVHYMIRFENTGTASAQNIVIADLIDTAKYDINSLVPLDASHHVRTKIINGNRVEFIFENINLPFDDANNDGYVAFKIKTKPTLVLGNTFSNTASIYFDYNFPIITNTATTTVALLANADFAFEDYLKIYPVPVKDVLNIEFKKSIQVSSIQIYNTLGQLVLTVPSAQQTKTVDVSSLKTGNYVVKINSEKGSSNAKFVKL